MSNASVQVSGSTVDAPSADVLPDRRALRRQLRRARRSLPIGYRRWAERAIQREATRLPAMRGASRVAFYLPADGEVDLTRLLDHPAARRKRLFLPTLKRGRHPGLCFAPYRLGDPLRVNRFGIPEPGLGPRRRVSPRQLDVVILPLVGFDPQGHRLGMGGGFYDRALAFRNRGMHGDRPRLIGVAFECQRVDALVAAPWDVPLDAIITEAGLYPTRRSAPASGRARATQPASITSD